MEEEDDREDDVAEELCWNAVAVSVQGAAVVANEEDGGTPLDEAAAVDDNEVDRREGDTCCCSDDPCHFCWCHYCDVAVAGHYFPNCQIFWS